MSERENNVYKAKLAEQAERYDGELKFSWKSSYILWKFKKYKAATLKKIFFHQWLPWLEVKKMKYRKTIKADKTDNKKWLELYEKMWTNIKDL